MMSDGWESPDPAAVLALTDDGWSRLEDQYGRGSRPFRRCLEIARSGGARTAVIETRYIDLDYRSEYSAFYSRTFASAPDSAVRLHFFERQLDAAMVAELPEDCGYLGYIVVRPSHLGPVGRAMLVPPPGMREAVRAAVIDEVHLFGQQLKVRAVPFVQQDMQLGRCAHAAAWMCHYSAWRRREVRRRPMADFNLASDHTLGLGRPVPSSGLTVNQLMQLFMAFELPAAFYRVSDLPNTVLEVPWAPAPPDPPEGDPPPHPGTWDTRLIRICCQYLNSGFPVLVGTQDHAFVLCGYERGPHPETGHDQWIRFIRHDDQRGPYLWVENVLRDVDHEDVQDFWYTPWEVLLIPLPDKLWLAPEHAELAGGLMLQQFAHRARQEDNSAARYLELIESGDLALRTYATSSNRFKRGSKDRLPPEVGLEYRLARMPRYVWVVEAVDRQRRGAGDPPVIGEAVLDATSADHQPDSLALHLPGVAWIRQTDGTVRYPIRCAPDPYASGGWGPP